MIPTDNYSSLGDILRDALVQFKPHVALIEANRKRETSRLTYLDFKRRAEPIARAFERRDIGPGRRVAVLMSNQSRWLLAAYATFFRGATLVPLDYKLTAPEQAALIAHCKPDALVIEHAYWKPLQKLLTHTPATVIVSEPPASATADALAPGVNWDAFVSDGDDGTAPTFMAQRRDDIATIVYSSGTGGAVKGCMLPHEAYLSQYDTLSRRFEMVPGDVFFSILPTNHAIDFMTGFIAPFCCGATVVHQRALRPEFINYTMKHYRITHMAAVPLLLTALEKSIRERLDDLPGFVRKAIEAVADLNEAVTRRQPNTQISRLLLKPIHDAFGGRLKVIFSGGAFVDPDRAQFFYRLGIPIAIGYGLTEACTVITVNDLKPFEVRIHNPDAHGVGEVWARGKTLMRGYFENPELTAQAIDADGWLHTTDLGYLDASHHLHLVGRAKNMIVTEGGKNIYPEDIESAFDGIGAEDLAVFASGYLWPAHQKLGGESLVVIARFKADTPAAQIADARNDLRERNRRLSDYKRARHYLSWPDEFPRTASMKLKRDVLAAQVRDRLSPDALENI
jgi:long-chain acyl-CoA synthetase